MGLVEYQVPKISTQDLSYWLGVSHIPLTANLVDAFERCNESNKGRRADFECLLKATHRPDQNFPSAKRLAFTGLSSTQALNSLSQDLSCWPRIPLFSLNANLGDLMDASTKPMPTVATRFRRHSHQTYRHPSNHSYVLK